jgi:MoaA/NifB/PqqE/SkfB family radical SAM enzyme
MLWASMAGKALRTRFLDHRPFILSHLLTGRCNADCVTCLWKMPAGARVDELSTAEVEALYGEAAAAGFRALVLWGGEPLLRPDAGAVLRAARARGLHTTLITNGWWLRDRADEVLPFVGRLMVSVDAIGPLHDRIRRLPGLFARLDEGLRYTRASFPDVVVIVNTVLSRMNADQLEPIAAYGERIADHVSFQAMDVVDYGYARRALDLPNVELDRAAEGDLARQIRALRRRGYPVRDSNAYLTKLAPNAARYRCNFKKGCLRVEPNGDVLDCTRIGVPLANIRDVPLRALLASPAFKAFQRRAEGCNRCRDVAVVEISHLWEGRAEALWHALGSLA